MSNLSAYDQLDADINALSAGMSVETWEAERGELLAVIKDLPSMPDPAFKARLKTDLGEALVLASGSTESTRAELMMPTLFGGAHGIYPVHRTSFALSVALHAAAMVLIVSSSAWLLQNHQAVKTQIISVLTDPGSYDLPVATGRPHGGGGGGDLDGLAASKGQPPRFAREQITPPMAVIRNDNPALVAEPTVVGPSSIKFPPSIMGDPLSNVTVASNGLGSGGGIGSGSGTGVGSGNGVGVGPGAGGGIGGGVFRVGGGVSAPRALYDPDPDYSEEARKARHQGVVVLSLIVDSNGRPYNIKVARSLGMGLDERAIETVRNWRFQPAMKDGRAVAVMINVEVNFHLY